MPPTPADLLAGPPPAAPAGGGGATFAGLAGQQQQAGPSGMSAGQSQIAASAVRMAMEIDQAIKVLAQQVPALMQWAVQTTTQLRTLLGQALNSGALPTSAVPNGQDAAAFPDGGGNVA